MKKNKAHYIAFLGIMSALVFVVLILESYIFMFLPVNPAFLSIPLAVALCLFGGWKDEFVGGTIFGCCSLIISFIFGYAPLMNPLVSVFPRVMMGVTAYWVYHLTSFIISKILNSRQVKRKTNIFLRETVPAALGGAVGALTNTVLVLLLMWAFGGDAFTAAFSIAIAFNSPVEMACCAVLVPAYIRIIKIATKNSNKILFDPAHGATPSVAESEKKV